MALTHIVDTSVLTRMRELMAPKPRLLEALGEFELESHRTAGDRTAMSSV
jgi:hypothetical protein